MKGKTKRWVLCFFLAAATLTVGVTSAAASDKVDTITKEVLKGMLEDPDLVILDVRAGRDWRSSEFKIAGARRVDPGKVSTWSGDTPRDKTIVLYCA